LVDKGDLDCNIDLMTDSLESLRDGSLWSVAKKQFE
jgi:hypothetical protein